MFADANKLKLNTKAFVRPPERISVSEAAVRYLKLKGGGGFVPWSSDKSPYMLEPMNLMNGREFHTIGFMGPARSAKTASLILAPIIHSIMCEPADIMMIHMGQNAAETFSKGELEPVLKADKEVKDALSPIARDNNVTFKRFKAGNLLEINWPVDSAFRGKSRRYVMITDYDAVPNPPEGDVYTLSRKRTASYQSLGTTLAESSPGFDCTDPAYVQKHSHESAPAEGIATIYMSGDRRRWYWQCPECNEWFIPEFETLVFDREETDPVKASQGVFMACPHNGCCIEEKLKNKLNKGGVWLKQGQTIDCDGTIHGEGIKSKVASFWLPGPAAAFARWDENFVQGYINARNAFLLTGDDSKLQAFYNVDCGRVYVPEREIEIDVDFMHANKHALPLGTVPDWAKFLIASVDVQGGKRRGFEIAIHAFGDHKVQAVVERFKLNTVMDGNREIPIRPDLNHEHWNELIKKVLDKQLPIKGGGFMRPIVMAYDTNGEAGVYDRAQEFYKANPAYAKRLFPIKGSSRPLEGLVELSKPQETKSKVKTRRRSKAPKNGETPLYLLSTDKLKDIITANMQIEAGLPKSVLYSHELDDSYFNELLAEERTKSGKWVQKGGANESFDLTAYIWAVLVFHKWVNHEVFDQDVFKQFRSESQETIEVTQTRRQVRRRRR